MASKSISLASHFQREAFASTALSFLNTFNPRKSSWLYTALALALVTLHPAVPTSQTIPAQNRMRAYFDTLHSLSTGGWDQADSNIWVETNELHHHLFYKALENKGGAMLGVSLQQNWDFIVHGKPSVYGILDINPIVTEVAVPVLKRVRELCATRREYLSMLSGIRLTEEEAVGLVTPVRNHPKGRLAAQSEWYTRVRALARRQKDNHAAEVLAIFENEVSPYLKLTPDQKKTARQFLEDLTSLKEDRSGLQAFLNHHVSQAWELDVDEKTDISTYLSSEENYKFLRGFEMAGLEYGVTGDIFGKSPARIGAWLKPKGERVTMVYSSNILEFLSREKTLAQATALEKALFKSLDQLPLHPDALYFDAFLSNNMLFPRLRPYARRQSYIPDKPLNFLLHQAA